jgi:hypothetical protein
MAGVVLPLVLGGLIFMHTVDPGPAAGSAAGGHAQVPSTSSGVIQHGGHEDCDGCHVGLHVIAACEALLGSIAVWRIAHRETSGTPLAIAASPDASPWPAPPVEPWCARPRGSNGA